MTEQFKASTIRSFYGALLTAAATFLATYQTAAGDRFETAGLAALSTFVAYMLARGAAEGLIDSRREATGAVTPADVGAYRPPIAPARTLHRQ